MIHYRPLAPNDYAAAMALWNAVPGVRPNESPEEFARILDRNSGLSFSAWDEGELIGAVLACHDGRRGYLYHLAVAETHRRLGIGRELVARAITGFQYAGIRRATLFVVQGNDAGAEFWRSTGWFRRDDLEAWSMDLQNSNE